MNNEAYSTNGSRKHEEKTFNVRQADEVLRDIQHARAKTSKRRKISRSIWGGLTTNEVIGYSATLMFFVLGVMVYLGALVPQWATDEYRNILMAVMFLYGIYRGVTTYAKANQWRRRQAFEAQHEEEEKLN